jgi:hypothetical protein
LRQVAVHPRRHQALREREVQPPARAQVRLRERQVLGHLVPHRLVAADGLIGFPGSEDELPVGDHVAWQPRAVHATRRVAQPEQQPDLRHHHPLPESQRELPRCHRHQVGPLPPERGDRSPKQLGCVPGIGVGEEEELARGNARTLSTCPGLAVPALGEQRAGHQSHPRVGRGQSLYDGAGLVGRAVVHHQQFERTVA